MSISSFTLISNLQFPLLRPHTRFRSWALRTCEFSPHPLSSRYSSRSLTCDFTDIPFYARTFTAAVHAIPSSPYFPYVPFSQRYVRFLRLRIFRTYCYRNSTCDSFFSAFSARTIFAEVRAVFSVSAFSARTVTATVHAIPSSPHFPHVQLPQPYMRFHRHPLLRTYIYHRGTCVFSVSAFSARTITATVHVIPSSPHFPHVQFSQRYVRFSPSPHFPHVQLPQQYMRFLLLRIFRTYSYRSLTCDFTDIPFYARTFTTEVHAFSPSPHFPHVQLPQWYIRFRTHFESFQIFSYDSFNIFNV